MEATRIERFPWRIRIPLALSLAVLLFAVITLIRWTGPAVALTYRWEPGGVFRDRMTIDMEIQTRPSILEEDVEMSFSMTEVTRVVEVDEQGNATLEIYVEDLEVAGNALGAEATEQIQQRERVVVTPDGRILESSIPGLDPAAMGDQRMFRAPLLPDFPVGPGDTWERDDTLEFGSGGFTFHSDNELLRYDEVNGVETVVVRSHVTGPFDLSLGPEDLGSDVLPTGGGRAGEVDIAGMQELRYVGDFDMEGETWVDPLTGDALRGEAEGSMSMSFETGQAFPMFGFDVDMEIEFERLD